MIDIVVKQGGNRISSVYVEENDLGVICVIVNYEKRWADYVIGSTSGIDDMSEDFYIYDPDAPEEFDSSVVELHHNGELDKMYQITNQVKDQLITYYMPYPIVEDGHMVAEWNDNV